MHHLKETVIDGVKFVLIPEELHDHLAAKVKANRQYVSYQTIAEMWQTYDPEIFDGQ